MKTRFPRAAALAVAKELCDALEPVTTRLIVAGSLRRMKPEVGDVEILFVPRTASYRKGLFAEDVQTVSLADECLKGMLTAGVLVKRPNTRGGFAWGEKNKLAIHAASGIPVDLFTATEASWFNYLVCRTGPGESNIAIAVAARDKGWQWTPYGPGFTRRVGLTTEHHPVTSEREVFNFVGLPFKEPKDR